MIKPNNTRWILGFTALLVGSACSSTSKTTAETPSQEPVVTAQDGPRVHNKLTAPVELTLTVSAKVGDVDATIDLKALKDIPEAVARFVLPAGVSLRTGDLETKLGALKAGDTRRLTLAITVPNSGSFMLAAGVDAVMSAAVRLNKSATVYVGPDAGNRGVPNRRLKLPDGSDLNIGK